MANAAAENIRQTAQKGFRPNPDSATLSDVRDDIAALRNDVVETVSDLAEAGAELGKTAAHRVAGQAKSAHESLSNAISTRPEVALLVAFGVGAIVARMLMSKR